MKVGPMRIRREIQGSASTRNWINASCIRWSGPVVVDFLSVSQNLLLRTSEWAGQMDRLEWKIDDGVQHPQPSKMETVEQPASVFAESEKKNNDAEGVQLCCFTPLAEDLSTSCEKRKKIRVKLLHNAIIFVSSYQLNGIEFEHGIFHDHTQHSFIPEWWKAAEVT